MPGHDIGDHITDHQQRLTRTPSPTSIRAYVPTDPRTHTSAHAAAIGAASRTFPRTAAKLASKDAPSVPRAK